MVIRFFVDQNELDFVSYMKTKKKMNENQYYYYYYSMTFTNKKEYAFEKNLNQ